MHRRGHKKSRNGCLECKRRHMKCDESRPQCANCMIVRRECQYMEHDTTSRAATHRPTETPSCVSNTSPTGTTSPPTEACITIRKSVEDGYTPDGSPGSAPSRSQTAAQSSTPQPHNTVTHDAVEHDEPVNLLHAELAFHFSVVMSGPELDSGFVDMVNRIVVKEANNAPFLLYECLAVSARHLSILRPNQHEFYLRHAVQLQTKAIAMFNSMGTVDPSNCVPSLLFSSVLNRHALVDVLYNRDGDFCAFVDRYVQSIMLQKGVRTVSKVAWKQLLESDLEPLMKWATPKRDTITVGHHCDEIRQLISMAPTLEPLDKEACGTAIHFLQLAFDAIATPQPDKSALQIAFVWGIFLPDEFCALLKAHRPEAAAVMAWYAVLLHELRDNWQIGDAGVFVLQSISEFLGTDWMPWLKWPFIAVQNGLR